MGSVDPPSHIQWWVSIFKQTTDFYFGQVSFRAGFLYPFMPLGSELYAVAPLKSARGQIP